MNFRRSIKKCYHIAFVSVLISVIFALISQGTVFASDDSTPLTNLIPGWPEMDKIGEASAVVMDADTGGIVYSLNRNTIRYPASTTKILTALVTLENASMDEVVTMDDTGLYYVMSGSTNAKTVAGEEFTVEQCLYVMLLKSANDIATQLGKHVGGGDLDHFMEMMNARAAEIGCVDTHFVNPSGMPDSEHYSTAEDMAKIMRECMKNETFRQIISTECYTVPPTNMTPTERFYENHCKLILPESEFYYEPCLGGKTGYTDAAWRTLVCAAEKDGRTLVAVTMKGPDNSDFTDMKRLFEYGFNNFHIEELDGVAVDLPDGFDTSLLTEETFETSDGGSGKVWKYNKLPVGELRDDEMEPAPEPESIEEQVTETPVYSEPSPKPAGSGEVGGSGGSGIFKVLFSIALVALFALIVTTVVLNIVNVRYGEQIRKSRRRRARRAEKRRIAKEHAKEHTKERTRRS